MDTNMCDDLPATVDSFASSNIDNLLRSVGQIVTLYCQNVTVAVVKCMPDLKWNATVPSCPTKDIGNNLTTMLIIVWAVGGVLLFAFLVLITIVISSRSKTACVPRRTNSPSTSIFHISGHRRGGDNPGFTRADERCGEWSFHRARPTTDADRLPSYHEAILNNYISVSANTDSASLQTPHVFVRTSAPPSYRTSQIQTSTTQSGSEGAVAAPGEIRREGSTLEVVQAAENQNIHINQENGTYNMDMCQRLNQSSSSDHRIRNQGIDTDERIGNQISDTSQQVEDQSNDTSKMSGCLETGTNGRIGVIVEVANQRMENQNTVASHRMENQNTVANQRMENQNTVANQRMENQNTVASHRMENQNTVASHRMENQNTVANQRMENQNTVANQRMENEDSGTSETSQIIQNQCTDSDHINENQCTINSHSQLTGGEPRVSGNISVPSRHHKSLLSGSSRLPRRYAENYPQCFLEDEPPPPYYHGLTYSYINKSPTGQSKQEIRGSHQSQRRSMHIVPSEYAHSRHQESELLRNQNFRRSMYDRSTTIVSNSIPHHDRSPCYQNSSTFSNQNDREHDSRRRQKNNHLTSNSNPPTFSSHHNFSATSVAHPCLVSSHTSALPSSYGACFPSLISPSVHQVPMYSSNVLHRFPSDFHVPNNNYSSDIRQSYLSSAAIRENTNRDIIDQSIINGQTNKSMLYVVRGTHSTPSATWCLLNNQPHSLPYRPHHFETQPLCTSTPISQSPAVDRKCLPDSRPWPLSIANSYHIKVGHPNQEQLIFQRLKAALEEGHTQNVNQEQRSMLQYMPEGHQTLPSHQLHPQQGCAPIARLDNEFL